MNIKYILLLLIILFVIYMLSYHNEHLTYDDQIELDMLNNQYDNSVPEDERITSNIDKRAELLNKMNF